MKIKTRLTLLFTSLTGVLLLIFSITIYLSSSKARQEDYYRRLKQQAATKANLLLDAKVEPAVLQLIYKNSPGIFTGEEVAIYDPAFHLLYHDGVDIDRVKETKAMIDSIAREKEIRFYIGNAQVVGFLYTHAGKNYVITAAAKDEPGYRNLALLRNTLAGAFCISVVLIFFAGRLFAEQALSPVSSLVTNVKSITATNLDLRVDEGNKKDEIAKLAITFNEMLNRLESSFDAQKHFVSNISHELRTPLSAIINELELSLNKDRDTAEYKTVIQNSLADARRLARLSHSLLDFAKASYDPSEIAFKEIRLDELLLDAQQQVKRSNPGYTISIRFENDLPDEAINIQGNEYLLKTAFSNLMENACKFSADRHGDVFISFPGKKIVLKFKDKGIGISEDDLPHLFIPFYRGGNKEYAEGNGIGLSLVQKIIHLHKGAISVVSASNKGTEFAVEF